MAKLAKKAVNYRPSTGTRRCGNCTMYRNGTCTLVTGTIDPKYVCDRWAAKRG